MAKIVVPIEGTGVVHQGEGPGGARGQRPAPGETATQGARGGAPENGAPGAQTPVERLRADEATLPGAQGARSAPAPVAEDVSNFEYVFDKWGRAKLVTKEQAAAFNAAQGTQATEDVVDDTADDGDISDVPAAPARDPQAAATGDVGALQGEVTRLTRLVELLAQSQLQGKPLAEMLGQQSKPAAPTPPDPTQFDFGDPQHVAEYHRQNNAYTQAVIQQSVREALEPHREAMDGARWQTQYNQVFAKHSKDPGFQVKMEAALNLVNKDKQRFSIPEAYDVVNQLYQALPQKAAPARAHERPARTLSAGEAAARRDQARNLPKANGGASGSGRPALPSNIKKLGAIIAWNQQFRRSQ